MLSDYLIVDAYCHSLEIWNDVFKRHLHVAAYFRRSGSLRPIENGGPPSATT